MRLTNYLNEKTTYYLDKTKDGTNRYVAHDGKSYYEAVVGIKKGEPYMKFRLAPSKTQSRLKHAAELKKVDRSDIEIAYTDMPIDFNKLYRN